MYILKMFILKRYVQFFATFKAQENRENSICPKNCKTCGQVRVKNANRLRRLKCSLVNRVILRGKLLVSGFTATDFSLRSKVDQ